MSARGEPRYAGDSHIGQGAAGDEDASCSLPAVAVADGLGGHQRPAKLPALWLSTRCSKRRPAPATSKP